MNRIVIIFREPNASVAEIWRIGVRIMQASNLSTKSQLDPIAEVKVEGKAKRSEPKLKVNIPWRYKELRFNTTNVCISLFHRVSHRLFVSLYIIDL